MFREVLGFELRQQLKSPLFWVIALAFGTLAFAAAGSDHIRIGGGIGNTHRNAPYVVVQMLSFFTVAGMFLIAVFVAGAALRDFDAGMAEMIFATPVSRKAYLGGRFAAGYLAAVGVLVVVALGLALGVLMPWVDPARLGATSFAAYGYGFAVFVLPSVFFTSALLFLLATLTRSMLGTYVGVIAFFVLWQVAIALIGNNLEHRTLGALIDPFGLGAFDVVTRYWSANDRNTRLPDVAGLLLANRAIWLGGGVALLVATMAVFRLDREPLRLWRRRSKAPVGATGGGVAGLAGAPVAVGQPPVATGRGPVGAVGLGGAPDPAGGGPNAPGAIALTRGQGAPMRGPTYLPSVTLRSDASARFLQFLKLARFDTRGVLFGVPFLVMLAFGLMNLAGFAFESNEIYGTKVYPVTHLMLDAMNGSYNFLLVIIVAFYAGELVWRERGARVSEVTDAFPLSDWIPLMAKLTALTAVIVIFLLAGSIECVIYQLIRGYHHLEPTLYLADIALTALQFLLVGILMLFLQVIANNKFVGYLLTVIFLVSRIALSQLHFDHHLYNYGSAPEAKYSDMNGYGHFLAGHLWFDAYWACLAVGMLVVAALYWSRGTSQGWKERSRIARQRFDMSARLTLAVSLMAFAGLGAWIFYNTNVINRYVPGDLANERQASYEKLYRRYQDLPQPRIVDVKIDMDIFPHERRLDVRGHYRMVNKTSAPIRDLHMRLPLDMELVAAKFPQHAVISDDRIHGYTIYRLEQPLAPGASMDFDFTLRYLSRGFRNTSEDTHVVDNGTFIDSLTFPHFGYSEEGQLEDRNERRKYGLGPVPRMPKIDDVAARRNSLVGLDSDWVTFATTVSTVPEQIALAPGYLDKEWTANGRRYFHYRMDAPILDFFSFQSARYAVKRDQWNGVALQVYYDPQHGYNVDRMLEAMKKSLAHFSKAYAPFQFRQMRILEFPGYQRFAQSFANTVPFSEAIGFIADLRDPDDIDYVFYVTAHEVAHQWWAHQVIGAYVQGVTMLDEAFAQYSALMVQEHEYGPAQMRKFLKYELDRYLSERSGELVEEMPLALVENQQYIHYRKGSIVMYALQDYLGEDLVDKTLARFDRDTAFQQPPYTTTREFLADLRQDAGPKWSPLIEDSFEKITLFDNRVIAAAAKRRPDGKYDLTLEVHASKIYVDGVGKETPAKVRDPVDVGVFGRAPDGKEQHQKVLYLEKRTVPDGDSSITITVDGEPFEAGIDPYNKLIDRVSDDNRMRVTIGH
jgi:ABC-2 type transport system permease protein